MRLEEVRGDLALGVRAWARAALLPIVTVLLAVAVTVSQGLGGGYVLAGLAVSVATIGFYGAQRLWYAAVWRGRPFSLEDAVDASRRMFGRFFRTGVLVLVPPSIVAMGATAAYYLRLVSAASSAPMRRRSSA